MANKKERSNEKDNNQIMSLPEEIFREMFCYLSIEMLHSSLRKVCRQMQYYVDRYMDVQGIFFLVSSKNCMANNIITIFKGPCKKFKIIWKDVPHLNQLNNLQKTTKRAKQCRSCPYNDLFFSAIDDTVVCTISHRPLKRHNWWRVQAFRYDILKDNWNVLCNNCTAYECMNLKHSADPISHCHPINLREGIDNSIYDNFLYTAYPFLQIVNDETTNISTGVVYEARFCRCYITLKKPRELHFIRQFSTLRVSPQSLLIIGGYCLPRYPDGKLIRSRNRPLRTHSEELVNMAEHPNTSHNFVNRYLHQIDLNQEGYTLSWKSKYIAEMPYRSNPFCFKLKNNLYIAGHRPGVGFDSRLNENERRLTCTICTGSLKHDDRNPNIWIESESVECSCCDKYDLLEEKYYRNICSLPTTLRNIVNLKIATNKNDSLAVIEFYDAVDCRDKLWIFTEKEEKFEEHCDPKSEPCKQCKDDPLNSNLVCRKRNHSSHFSCKKQILRIQ